MIAEWDGPAWAAPLCVERHRTGAEVSLPSTGRTLLGALAAALAQKLIDAKQFQLALPLGRRS